jgi:hypothetical protein
VINFAMDGHFLRVVRRSFWCPTAQQEVEVEFEAVGIPGLRHLRAVRGCPARIACRRSCLDVSFRSRWPPALPIRTR